jgi:hypothetical protein
MIIPSEVRATLLRALPHVLPSSWSKINAWAVPGSVAFNSIDGLTVLVSVDVIGGIKWLHMSISRRERYPSWDDICAAKDLFVGRDREAIQVLPKASEHVNLHCNCFHVWSNLDGPTTPQEATR